MKKTIIAIALAAASISAFAVNITATGPVSGTVIKVISASENYDMCDHVAGCVRAGGEAPGYSATTGLSMPINVGGDVIPVGIINDEGKVFLINGGELIGCNESADLCNKPIKIETWKSGDTIYQIPGGTYFIVYKTK